MITLYGKKATDYTTNGLVVLDPYIISAKISERMNGEYKLDMELAVDQRTMVAANEMVIKAPAPIRETPQIDIESTHTVTREIYKVTTGGQRLYLRVKPSQSARGIHAYKPGTEVAVLDKSNGQWYKVAVLDGGASGYMYAANLTYVRSETQSQGVNAPQHITTPAKTRDQLFRISKITSTLESIQIEALHISYDMRRNFVKSATIKGKTGADAMAAVFAAAMTDSDFTLHSDIDKVCEEDIAGKSLVAALLSDGGLVDQAGGEVLRDNYDLYWYNNIGYDRGVSIAYRKNMAGMEISVDTSDIVTQIVPVGYDKKNNPIYGDPVDSAHVAEYAHPYIKEYSYKDVKVGKEYKNEAAVKTELAKRAAAEYDAKIDLPKVSATVEYVDIKNTSAGRDFAAYTNVYIGDTVRIRHEDYGFDLATKVVAYVWDCTAEEYESIELDSKQAQLSDIKINPSMIGNGTLASRKLGVGAVMNVNMAENSVESDQIAEGAIDSTGKMTQLVVDALSAEAVTAIRADIRQLVAGQITTDQLYADLAAIAVAQITTANISNANIDWATIANLTAAIANIANAQIGSASIGTAQIKDAKIDWAKIYDLTADTAIISEGVGGKLYIARLAVTEANMTSLTVGELMVKAEDGSFKRLTVDADGNVTAETVQVEGGNVADNTISGGKLIENTITARELNVESIFADTALIRAIKAANIDVSDLFAAEATISALNSWLIKADTIQSLQGQLNLWASDKISAAVSGMRIGGTNLLHGISVWGIIDGEGFSYDSSGASAMGTYVAQNDGSLLVTNSGSNLRVSHSGLAVHQGEVYTVSAEYKDVSGECAHQFQMIFRDSSGTFVGNAVSEGDNTTLADGWVKSVFTFTIPEGAAKLAPCLRSGTDYTLYTHQYYIRHPKLERGNKATDWSPNPNELRDVRVGSNILMDTEHTEISTPYLDIDVSGTEGDMHIDENGISGGTGTFKTLNCPDVVKSTGSAIYSGGLQEAFNALNGRFLTGNVTISLSTDQYGTFMLKGVYGVNASINIVGNGHSINGALAVYNCKLTNVGIGGVTINGNGSSTPLALMDAGYVSVIGVTVNGGGAGTAIDANYGTRLMMYDNGLYNAGNLIRLGHCTEGSLVQLRGGSCTNYLRADGARWTMSGTRPDGTYAQENTCLHAPENPDSLTIDYGTSQPPVTPVTTTSFAANMTGTYYPSGHWISNSSLIQGRYDTTRHYACMWFDAGSLDGKTIKSATLTIKRIAGAGKSSAVNVALYTSPVTGKSGKPTTGAVSLGTLGKAENGETVIVNLPTSAIAAIASGGALMLDPGDTENASNKRYSSNYARFEGKDDGTPPVLTVTYQ